MYRQNGSTMQRIVLLRSFVLLYLSAGLFKGVNIPAGIPAERSEASFCAE